MEGLSLKLDDFKLIELDQNSLFDTFYNKYPPHHSDYSFSTMVCWQDYMKYYYVKIEESIVIMTETGGNLQFRPARGAPTRELDEQVVKLAIKEGTDPPMGVIDTVARERLRKLYHELTFEPHREFFDYVYLASDLAELAGRKYMKLRNLLNRFRKRYEYTVEPITADNLNEVIEFLTRWCLWKDCDKIPLLSSERDAVMYCVGHYSDLGMQGLLIRIDGEIEAVAIYEQLNPETAVVHFEKAITDFDGLYQAINQETAKLLQKDYKFINRESDMGFPGLRQAKEKYGPDHMVEVYHLSRDELEKVL